MRNPRPAPARTLVRPENPVVVIGRQFIEKRQVELTVTSNKVRSGQYLKVTDVEDKLRFQIKKKAVTAHNRSFLQDNAGNIILTLRQKMMTMHGTWEVFKGEGKDLLFTAKRSSAFRSNTESELHIFLSTNTTQEFPDYKIDGSWSDMSFNVCFGNSNSNTTLAEITLMRGHKIAVKVAPTVDHAFIATLVIFLGSFDPPVSPRSAFRFTFAGVQFVLGVLGLGLGLE